MPSRRSLLSHIGPAALTGALFASPAVARPAADFVGIDGWLNTAGPLTLAGLRGRVVLIEFCTYTCINWRRTLPYVNRWDAEYGHLGLQVVGVHTPEFGFERVRPNVESVIGELGVRYPIAQDNAFMTWRAWGNRAWPSFYLLDRDGRVRLVREGEGHAGEIEQAIRDLLGLARAPAGSFATGDADLSGIRTPEMYFGSLHPTPQDRAQPSRHGEAAYSMAELTDPRLNEYQLDGVWARAEEPLTLRSRQGRVRLRFSAAKVHVVAGAPRLAPLRIRVDNGEPRVVQVGIPTMYTVLDGNAYGEHLLEIECESPGFSLYSATFG